MNLKNNTQKQIKYNPPGQNFVAHAGSVIK